MAAYAELIFIAGPQKGQRATLVGKAQVAGRASECDIQITEEFASRKHLGLELTGDGWVVQNLSTNPIWVNGKKYKADKKIILDTGDVVRLALKTEMLYVAPGDDAEAALAAWKQANSEQADPPGDGPGPGPATVPLPSRAEAKSALAAPVGVIATRTGASPKSPPPLAGKLAPVAPAVPADEAALARKGKTRKYILFGGVFGLSLVGLVLAVVFRPREQATSQRQYLQFTRDMIREIVETPCPVRAPQKITSQKYEVQAMATFKIRHDEPGNLYRCVKQFKLALAYRNNLPSTAEVAKNFATAKRELIQEISHRYEDGYVDIHNSNWRRAKENFEALLRIYPVKEDPEPEIKNPIWETAIQHLTDIGAHLGKSKSRY